MPERVTHANEIEAGVREGKPFAAALHKPNAVAFLIFMKHATAGIDAHDLAALNT